MDILKKDNYRLILILLLLSAVIFDAFASEKQATQMLIDSYKLPEDLIIEGAEKAITDLNHALNICTDKDFQFRIKYRIAMLYFKASNFGKACDYFKNISQAQECPDLIRMCSFNMSGQIHRMQAKDKEALGAFEELIVLSKTYLQNDPNRASPSTVLKLAITARFAKAEIFQYQQEYDSAISEYKRILAFLEENKISNTNSYAPLAMDRISQLSLMRCYIEGFSQPITQLIEKYPDYYRTPIIRLEAEAVKILKQKNEAVDFARGSFEAPARLIAFLKDTKDKELINRITILLENLRSEYQGTYGGILLGYHHAWLLDAAGQKQEAAKVLDGICKEAASGNYDNPGITSVISMLTDYARLQQAVILGEAGNYRDALEIVYSVRTDPNDTHLSNLTDSIKKALETLKREVPKNVNDQ